MNAFIQTAIHTSATTMETYWVSTLTQRLPGGAGSIVEGFTSPLELEAALASAEWEEYTHPAIMAGCQGWKTSDIKGSLGIVDLGILPPESEVVLDDRKGTGFVSCTVAGQKGANVNFTVLITGEDKGQTVVFTFHPGEPCSPSRVKAEPGLHGKKITAAEALSLGLNTAKIT